MPITSAFLSESAEVDFTNSKVSEGQIKLRLAHSTSGTIILPEILFHKKSSWNYFIPSFFSPPVLDFNIEREGDGKKYHKMKLSLDIRPPDKSDAMRVIIEVSSEGLLKKYHDGSQLYKCKIYHQGPLLFNRSGMCRLYDDDFWITVYHHTSGETAKKIRESKMLLGSSWNIQGTHRLKNVCYPYFTTLRKIKSEQDLLRIAMSASGDVTLFGIGPMRPFISLKVYRESTSNRTVSIKMRIPVEILSPFHLRLYVNTIDNQFPYYEVSHPEIIRVGLEPGESLHFERDKILVKEKLLKRFDYVICGDATTESGLIAPFEEEETKEIFHLENLNNTDIFSFWQDNANTDQVVGRRPEYVKLQND